MSTAIEKSGPVERALNLLDALAPHALDGLTNKELIAKTGYSPSDVSRDLDRLAELGRAEKRDGRWHPSPKSLAVHRAYVLHMEAFASRATELNSRVEARAHQLA